MEKRQLDIYKHLSLCLVGFTIEPPDPGENRWPDTYKCLASCLIGFTNEPSDQGEKDGQIDTSIFPCVLSGS